ncbi:MAG TPA: hypothetical protein PK174_04800 [Anaerolineaceae bacterium]|nr:hypothetical protein [Anaerolineaceae bacterium]
MKLLPFDNNHPFYTLRAELEKVYQDIRIVEIRDNKNVNYEYFQTIKSHYQAGYRYLYEVIEKGLVYESVVVTFGRPRPAYSDNLHPYPLRLHTIKSTSDMYGYEIRSIDQSKIAYCEHESVEKDSTLKEVIRLWIESSPENSPVAYSGITVCSDKAREVFEIYEVQHARKLGDVVLERGKNSASILGRDTNGKVIIGLYNRAGYEWEFLLGDHAGPLIIRCDWIDDHPSKQVIFRIGNPCRKSPEEEAFILMCSLWCFGHLRRMADLFSLVN